MHSTRHELVDIARKAIAAGKHLTLYIDGAEVRAVKLVRSDEETVQFEGADGNSFDVAIESLSAVRTVKPEPMEESRSASEN